MATTHWHNRELIVLMGAPGAGKTTYARRYPYVVTADKLRIDPTTSTDEVFNALIANAINHLKRGHRVVIDTTARNPTFRRRALSIARAYHAIPRLVYVQTPVETCIRRQAGREHPVPIEAVRDTHAAITAQVPTLRLEGWASIHTIHGGDA